MIFNLCFNHVDFDWQKDYCLALSFVIACKAEGERV